LLGGLVIALRTLTVAPIPGKEADEPASALFWFPVVGGMIGAVCAAAGWAANSLTGWPAAAALVMAGLGTVLSGGIHLDGLADVADSAGGATREKRLAIMKDSRIGCFGAAAVVFAVLAKVLAFERLVAGSLWVWAAAPFLISRSFQIVPMTVLRYARPEGGAARRFVEGAKTVHMAFGVLFPVVIAVAAGRAAGLAAVSCAGLAAGLFIRWADRNLGGVTGDVVGALSEIVEVVSLLAFAAMASGIGAGT